MLRSLRPRAAAGSSGIGRALALLAGARGYAVAVHYRKHQAEAEYVAEQIRRAGGRALALQADLRNGAQIVQLYGAVERDLGPLEAVVNSAGMSLPCTSVSDLEAEPLEALVLRNVVGLMLSCREAVRRMSRRFGGQGGVIVNVSSMAAAIGGRAGSAAYAASKAAVDAFTVGLAKEVAR